MAFTIHTIHSVDAKFNPIEGKQLNLHFVLFGFHFKFIAWKWKDGH
jgi:hypothetical protein